jgi:hypothetical protein
MTGLKGEWMSTEKPIGVSDGQCFSQVAFGCLLSAFAMPHRSSLEKRFNFLSAVVFLSASRLSQIASLRVAAGLEGSMSRWTLRLFPHLIHHTSLNPVFLSLRDSPLTLRVPSGLPLLLRRNSGIQN